MLQFDKPFPHTVIDDYLSPQVVRKINKEWPNDWSRKSGKTSIKWHTNKLPASAQSVVDAVDISMVEKATGITGLFGDQELFGAGLHCIPTGGFLKMHLDYNMHPKGWHRRVNMLIYLNEGWDESWGGDLQLENGDSFKLITPIGGRCVIFETNEESWHGHPLPLMCPGDRQRRSLALYFYTIEPPLAQAHTTIYRKCA